MQMTPLKWEKSEEELKRLLMKVKEKSEKVGLKLNYKTPRGEHRQNTLRHTSQQDPL